MAHHHMMENDKPQTTVFIHSALALLCDGCKL